MTPELVSSLRAAASVVREALNPWVMFLTPATKGEFVRERLLNEMRNHRGKKRLRKKKAKHALERLWLARTLARPLARRLDYAALAKQLVSVQPLPQKTIDIYAADIDVTSVVTGGGE